ncbi:MAG: hypothetical protein WCS86_01620 [Candidatus Paceibacterota bacterium]
MDNIENNPLSPSNIPEKQSETLKEFSLRQEIESKADLNSFIMGKREEVLAKFENFFSSLIKKSGEDIDEDLSKFINDLNKIDWKDKNTIKMADDNFRDKISGMKKEINEEFDRIIRLIDNKK